jgi:aminoglycoside phosphotransferase (APT) family kinase protein
MKMHVDEVDTEIGLVRCLLRAQFPQWAGLPLVEVPSTGTDNALYRLGEELQVRLPRIHWAVHQVETERVWLPRIAPRLPLQIPEQVAVGQPGEGYPYPWGIYRWLGGENATLEDLPDPCGAARDLANFILALQGIETDECRPAEKHNQRGLPLIRRDEQMRAAIAEMDGLVDTGLVTAAWVAALEAPDWEGPPRWFHGDLLPGNLLFQDGRLRAVIDFSGLAVGDPACDLMSAWALFDGRSREVFRHVVGVDEATWARGRGHALSQAVIFIPYYLQTNPLGVRNAWRALRAVLGEFEQ